jgi:hypothetical protein
MEYDALNSRPPQVVTKVETKIVEKIPDDYHEI